MNEVLKNPLPSAPKELAFALLRVPFFLEPHADETKPFVGTNRQRLIEKWGGPEGTMYSRILLSNSPDGVGWEAQKQRHDLKGRGLAAGIPYFNLDRLVGNTMASHRLIQMIGKTFGLYVSENVYDLLNEYYFVQGHSLNDQPLLAKIVSERLMELVDDAPSETELLDFLRSDKGRAEIEAAIDYLHDIQIHSIPKFIIEGSIAVDGAATPDVFVDVFRDIERRGSIKSEPIFAPLLGIETIQASHSREQLEKQAQ